MDEQKDSTKNARVSQLAETLDKLGYKILQLEFVNDEKAAASQPGVPLLELTLSL